MARKRVRGVGVVLMLGIAVAAVHWLATDADPAPAGAGGSGPVNGGQLLAQLVVAEEDDGARYKRAEWGEDWANHGGGCDTRELVLLASADGAVRGEGCRPSCPATATPCWTSPYDGGRTDDPGDLEIDHRVALSEVSRSRVVDAHGKVGGGAGRVWTPEQKHSYYEDRANLVAATAAVNSGKGDLDAGDWKPGIESAWCDYATAYVQTKVKWHLTVNAGERDGLAQMLATCRKR